MLKRLGLTQPKCRYLPLYVHGRQLLVQGPGEGDSSASETHHLQLNVVSKPPRYFREALRKLGIQNPWEDIVEGCVVLWRSLGAVSRWLDETSMLLVEAGMPYLSHTPVNQHSVHQESCCCQSSLTGAGTQSLQEPVTVTEDGAVTVPGTDQHTLLRLLDNQRQLLTGVQRDQNLKRGVEGKAGGEG
ncbi:hypothetical protein chiPu_0026647 [Chiloscyllium punctatum]|uniref:Uncharacterized protein n=1 Tax=Chiloscyllium punctatum TaxID=137246 RepID=A0A401TJA6_CHIPU|nr:hypothetical protein [Chiloscyllium punctatum]